MATRRSQRLSQRLTAAPEAGVVDVEAVAEELSPPAKRRKTKKAVQNAGITRKGKKGKLSRFVDMPLDILYEIFRHLYPLDLLRLSWTTKALRATLTTRRVRFLWTAAISNASLPACPDEVTEPQWARLAFYPHCSYCGAPNVHNIFWLCRVRCCNKCLKQRYISEYKHPIGLELQCLIPHAVLVRSGSEEVYYPKAAVDEFMAHLTATIGDREALVQLLMAKSADLLALQDHAELCCEWQEEEKIRIWLERKRTKDRRLSAIKDKLRGLGYGEEVDALEEFDSRALADHPAVAQPKELTDRAWNSMKATIIAFLHEKKAARLARERLNIITSREAIVKLLFSQWTAGQPPYTPLPRVADVCQMTEFRQIIEEPSDVEVGPESFQSAIANLPRLCEEWRSKVRARLVAMLPDTSCCQTHPTAGPKEERLELATTWFFCTKCLRALDYPRVMFHECMFKLDFNRRDYCRIRDEPLVVVDEPAERYYKLGCEPWDMDDEKLKYCPGASHAAWQIVRLNGGCPGTTTGKEMDKLQAWYSRASCRSLRTQKHTVYSWKSAVQELVLEGEEERKSWFRICGRDEAAARELSKSVAEELWSIKFLSPEYRWTSMYEECNPLQWCCNLCRTRLFEFGHNVPKHLAERHGIHEPHGIRQYLHYNPDAGPWPLPVDIELTSVPASAGEV